MDNSQPPLSELKTGVSDETTENIEATFETESELDEYIRSERKRRERERQQRLEQELEAARQEDTTPVEPKSNAELTDELNTEYNPNIDTDLSRDTARIKSIDSSFNTFTIELSTRNGNTFSTKLDFALPEDTGSEWVRLCNWLNVNPERPTELRGEIVPVTIEDNDSDRTIDIPPIQAGLNSIAYKTHRITNRTLTTTPAQKLTSTLSRTLPWWGTAIWFLVSFALLVGVFTLPDSAKNGASAILLFPFLIAVSISLMASAWYTLIFWGGIPLKHFGGRILIPTLRKTAYGIKYVHRTLFPKPD